LASVGDLTWILLLAGGIIGFPGYAEPAGYREGELNGDAFFHVYAKQN